jgi:hypothetical protein
MQNYTLTQIGETKTIFKKKVKTFQLYKNNKKEITPNEINNLYKTFLEKAKPNTQLRIRGLGIDKMQNIGNTYLKEKNKDLKVYTEEEFMDAEYYEGRAKDIKKFLKFSQLEFTLYED